MKVNAVFRKVLLQIFLLLFVWSSQLSFAEEVVTTSSQQQKKVAVLYDEGMLKHFTGDTHPERPERLSEVVSYLKEQPYQTQLMWPKIKPATNDVIQLVHTPNYINLVEQEVASLSENETRQLTTGDTILSKSSLKAAQLAVGAVVDGVDLIMQQQVNSGFALVRPPGHHAFANAGMGFCIYNNVAIAARYLQQKYGLQRILIVDFDVHHGNGTQQIFYDDRSVYYFSVHQSPLYPGTGFADEKGEGNAKGFTHNIELAAGSGDAQILDALNRELVPAMRYYQPEFILVSAGIDSHAGDLLGRLSYSDSGYAQISKILLEMANTYNQGRILYALEGGYTIENLKQSTSIIIKTLLGDVSSGSQSTELQKITK